MYPCVVTSKHVPSVRWGGASELRRQSKRPVAAGATRVTKRAHTIIANYSKVHIKCYVIRVLNIQLSFIMIEIYLIHCLSYVSHLFLVFITPSNATIVILSSVARLHGSLSIIFHSVLYSSIYISVVVLKKYILYMHLASFLRFACYLD